MRHTVSELDPVPYTTTRIIDKTGDWRTFKPIVKREFCKKCEICVDFCPDGVIYEGEDSIEIDYDFCKGCGICANECPLNAIEMVEER